MENSEILKQIHEAWCRGHWGTVEYLKNYLPPEALQDNAKHPPEDWDHLKPIMISGEIIDV